MESEIHPLEEFERSKTTKSTVTKEHRKYSYDHKKTAPTKVKFLLGELTASQEGEHSRKIVATPKKVNTEVVYF